MVLGLMVSITSVLLVLTTSNRRGLIQKKGVSAVDTPSLFVTDKCYLLQNLRYSETSDSITLFTDSIFWARQALAPAKA